MLFRSVSQSRYCAASITYTDVVANPVTVPVIADTSPVKGDTKTPSVAIVEYCQFGSSGCKTMASELGEVLKSFPSGVAVVWKDVPNPSLIPDSLSAALAARCAQDQGKFWEYHDALFSTGSLKEEIYTKIAVDLGLKEKTFTSCLKKQLGLSLIQEDTQEASALEVAGTPTLYINGERIAGAIRTTDLINRVEDALKTSTSTTSP